MLTEDQIKGQIDLRKRLHHALNKLDPEELELILWDNRLKNSISPDDGKYWKATSKVVKFFSHGAEFGACAKVQLELLRTRQEFQPKLVSDENIKDLELAITKFEPIITDNIESKITKHDQLAVIETLSLFTSQETTDLLHGGTTSYDILDTARSYLMKQAWNVVKQEMGKTVATLSDFAEIYSDVIQVGRTHLQHTSPVSFGSVLSNYARKLAERFEKTNEDVQELPGKISGIVGTGASVEQISGIGKSQTYEEKVLEKLGLKPDKTASQIVDKAPLYQFASGIINLASVAADLAGDIRILYSSEIQEVTSRENAERLGGSSAQPSKNNPINYENMEGKMEVIKSGLPVVASLLQSDNQRDLRGSCPARYQPQAMVTQTYEMLNRLNRALSQLSINEDMMKLHLRNVRDLPDEATTAILRAKGYSHPEYGDAHNFVKEMSKRVKQSGEKLIEVLTKDDHFCEYFNRELDRTQQEIICGKLELYLGHSKARLEENVAYARSVLEKVL